VARVLVVREKRKPIGRVVLNAVLVVPPVRHLQRLIVAHKIPPNARRDPHVVGDGVLEDEQVGQRCGEDGGPELTHDVDRVENVRRVER